MKSFIIKLTVAVLLTAMIGFSLTACDGGNNGDDDTTPGTTTTGGTTGGTTGDGTAPTITTSSLPNGMVGITYGQILTATGTAPITWSLDSGALPAGLTLEADGTFSGKPTAVGSSTFTVKATNAAGDKTRQLIIAIAPSSLSTTIEEVTDYLTTATGTQAAPADLYVQFDLGTMTDSNSNWQKLLGAINTSGKYMNLNLSACTIGGGSGTEFNPDYTVLSGKDKIVSIALPDTATSIVTGTYSSDGAFYNFSALKTFSLGTGITVIPDFAFAVIRSLTMTALPPGITEIGNSAFTYCENLALTSLPAGLTEIGSFAFSNCTNLALTALPAGLTVINGFAFLSCTNLKLNSLPDGLIVIRDNAFNQCTNLALTQLPAGLKTIGERAFRFCTKLALTALPAGLTGTIGNQTFNGCENITLTELPAGITAISDQAFQDCKKLALSALPAGLTGTIGYNAFTSCENITLTELPAGITAIGQEAFRQCTKLALASLPAGLKTIGEDAFAWCVNLALTELPEGLTTIGDGAFWGCSGLTRITLPASLTSIIKSAFWGCTNLTRVTFAVGSNIASNRFGDNAFPEGTSGNGGNNLRTAYTSVSGGAGIYTRAANGTSWTIQYPSAITTTSLPDGVVGEGYSQTLTATGTAPITWSLNSGTLPAGLGIAADGTISGTPTTAGTSTFTIKATNAVGEDTKQFSISIAIPIYISNTEEWEAALLRIQGEGSVGVYAMIINSDSNIGVTGRTTATFGSTATGASLKVILKNAVGNTRFPYLTSQGNFFRIGARQTFIIDGVTLQGLKSGNMGATTNNNTSLVYIADGGTLELKEGGRISTNASTSDLNGGGVYVGNGTFTMYGGQISGNSGGGGNLGGGGVFVTGSNSCFTMYGGVISGNSTNLMGGGVYVDGTFRLVTGTIYGATESTTSLRNTGISQTGAMGVRSSGRATRGVFEDGEWVPKATLGDYNYTIKVENGEIVP